jgi:hypothetical protein
MNEQDRQPQNPPQSQADVLPAKNQNQVLIDRMKDDIDENLRLTNNPPISTPPPAPLKEGEGWEAEFDERFDAGGKPAEDLKTGEGKLHCDVCAKNIKDFIHRTIKASQEATLKEMCDKVLEAIVDAIAMPDEELKAIAQRVFDSMKKDPR